MDVYVQMYEHRYKCTCIHTYLHTFMYMHTCTYIHGHTGMNYSNAGGSNICTKSPQPTFDLQSIPVKIKKKMK